MIPPHLTLASSGTSRCSPLLDHLSGVDLAGIGELVDNRELIGVRKSDR